MIIGIGVLALNEIINRFLTQFGDAELVEKFSALSNSDFNTLMLEIHDYCCCEIQS